MDMPQASKYQYYHLTCIAKVSHLSNNGLVFGQLVKEGYVHIEVIDTGYLKDYYLSFNLVQENNIRSVSTSSPKGPRGGLFGILINIFASFCLRNIKLTPTATLNPFLLKYVKFETKIYIITL